MSLGAPTPVFAIISLVVHLSTNVSVPDHFRYLTYASDGCPHKGSAYVLPWSSQGLGQSWSRQAAAGQWLCLLPERPQVPVTPPVRGPGTSCLSVDWLTRCLQVRVQDLGLQTWTVPYSWGQGHGAYKAELLWPREPSSQCHEKMSRVSRARPT